MASLLIAAEKEGGGVRPIAVNEVKLATMYAMNMVKAKLPSIFEPVQLGVGASGGSARAVQLIQAGLESMGPKTILLKCDIRNAFNSRKREQILAELFKQEDLKPIWRLAHWAYKDISSLLVFDNGQYRCTIDSAQGVKQGDCLGAGLFANSVHPFYLECSQDANVLRVCIMDDGNFVGSFELVLAAYDKFAALLVDSGLEIRPNKCGILCPFPDDPPQELVEKAAKRGIAIHLGAMPTFGAMVGFNKEKISAWVAKKVQKQKILFNLLQREELPAQVALLICPTDYGLPHASDPS